MFSASYVLFYIVLFFIVNGLDFNKRNSIVFNVTKVSLFEQCIPESNILTKVNACIY